MEKKILIIDNYDSFTYNLVHITEAVSGLGVDVVKNDQIDLIKAKSYSHVILSPGPGIPDEAGQLKEAITQLAGRVVLLGVCLGLQAIGEVYGGSLKNLEHVYHGVKTKMFQTSIHSPIFNGIDLTFEAGRYHSWVIDRSSPLKDFDIIAVDENDEIMAIQHQMSPIYAVQFHPESIMTDDGDTMIRNFLNIKL